MHRHLFSLFSFEMPRPVYYHTLPGVDFLVYHIYNECLLFHKHLCFSVLRYTNEILECWPSNTLERNKRCRLVCPTAVGEGSGESPIFSYLALKLFKHFIQYLLTYCNASGVDRPQISGALILVFAASHTHLLKHFDILLPLSWEPIWEPCKQNCSALQKFLFTPPPEALVKKSTNLSQPLCWDPASMVSNAWLHERSWSFRRLQHRGSWGGWLVEQSNVKCNPRNRQESGEWISSSQPGWRKTPQSFCIRVLSN